MAERIYSLVEKAGRDTGVCDYRECQEQGRHWAAHAHDRLEPAKPNGTPRSPALWELLSLPMLLPEGKSKRERP